MAKGKADDDRTASAFSAMGEPTRLALVSRLSEASPQSISQLSEGFGLTRQGITKHLRVLEHAGIVRSTRVGRESQFTYVPDAIEPLRTYLDAVSAQWDDALARLDSFLEKDRPAPGGG